jgi:transcriptional regulator with XRE-family HTH domain
MGRRPRYKSERLAEKLVQIRLTLGLSQTEMLYRLGVEDLIPYTQVSQYERGRNEPPLPILIRYARIAGIHMEDLVDDELDLPDKLPGTVRYKGIKRASATQGKNRQLKRPNKPAK